MNAVTASKPRGCPSWCIEDHNLQPRTGLRRFHASAPLPTPLGLIWVERVRRTHRIVIEPLPHRPQLTDLTRADAKRVTAVLAKLDALVGAPRTEGATSVGFVVTAVLVAFPSVYLAGCIVAVTQ